MDLLLTGSSGQQRREGADANFLFETILLSKRFVFQLFLYNFHQKVKWNLEC